MEWEGDTAVPYLDASVFARFVEEELLIPGDTVEARRAFSLLEGLFIEGDEPTRDLIGVGILEDIQTLTSNRSGATAQVLALLPPVLTRVWHQIERQWPGRSSLMDVLEAETRGAWSPRTWAELIYLS